MNYKKKEKDLLLSLILGDGSIYKINTSYSIEIGHGEKQLDYLKWKINLLNNNHIFKTPMVIHSKLIKLKQYSDKTYLQYYSKKGCMDLKEIYNIYYSENNRIKTLLSNIHSDRSLGIWFMDDGSVFKRKKKHKDGSVYYLKPTLKLCTHCFSKEENLEIIDWFKRRYLLEGKLVSETKKNKKYYYIRFNALESLKIFKTIKKYIDEIESMRVKFGFFYEYYNM